MESIQYKGRVTVALRWNNRIIDTYVGYNEGTVELFRSICSALTGKTPSATSIPQALSMWKKVGKEYREVTTVRSMLTARTVEESGVGACKASFTAVITSGQLVAAEKNEVRELWMMGSSVVNNAEHKLASIPCSDLKPSAAEGWNGDLKEGEAAVITWEMIVSNPSSSPQTN